VDFATDVFQLVTSFNGLSLTDTEVGLFAAIVLLTPDRPGVSDVKTVQHSQDRIVEAFKLQVSQLHRPMVVYEGTMGEKMSHKCTTLFNPHELICSTNSSVSVPVACRYRKCSKTPIISDYFQNQLFYHMTLVNGNIRSSYHLSTNNNIYHNSKKKIHDALIIVILR